MKKIISILALVAILFTSSMHAENEGLFMGGALFISGIQKIKVKNAYLYYNDKKTEGEFMFEFINGKFRQNNDVDCHAHKGDALLFDKKDVQTDTLNFIPAKPLKFSAEAKAVFEAGREIWHYYHQNANDKDYNVNASLYDIKAYFQGYNTKGRMNNTSKDEHYNKLMDVLSEALKTLAQKKITPKIATYGFLRE